MQYLLLAHLGAANLVVDRLCRISEADRTHSRNSGNAAMAMAQNELVASREFSTAIHQVHLDDNARFLYDSAQISLQLAEARLNSSTEGVPFNPPSRITEETNACLNIVADAARLDYHATQMRGTPNHHAMVLHSQSADSLITDIHFYAETVLDPDGQPIQPDDDSKHLFEAAYNALREAITGYTRMIQARRQLATATKSRTIANMTGQDQIDRLIDEYRTSDQVISITTARLQPAMAGAPTTVVPIIVFESALTIHCKTIAEEYPPDTPVELVQQHVANCSEFIQASLDQGYIQANEAQTIQRHTLAIHQAAQAGLHETPISAIQDFVDELVAKRISPSSIHEMIMAMANSQGDLVNYLLSNISIPPATTADQSHHIMAAALTQGLHPATLRAIAAVLDVDPDGPDAIPDSPYGSEDLKNILEAGNAAAMPPIAFYRAAAAAGFDADQLSDAVRFNESHNRSRREPAPPTFQSPLIVPGHSSLA